MQSKHKGRIFQEFQPIQNIQKNKIKKHEGETINMDKSRNLSLTELARRAPPQITNSLRPFLSMCLDRVLFEIISITYDVMYMK